MTMEPKPRITDAARSYRDRLYPAGSPTLERLEHTDPEFAERFENFAFDQVVTEGSPDGDPLPDRARLLTNLAYLLGCQGLEAFRMLLPAALEAGLEPAAVQETVYQASAYLGTGRMLPFIAAVNEALQACGIEAPLPRRASTDTTYESRAVAGEAKQVAFFGEGMRGFAEAGNPEYPQINRWLASHCFGDWYTRDGLSDHERELITLCFLAAQGGCEPQLTSHARANMRIGNTKAFLLKVVSANVPWIGYPRTLNAIRCIEDASA